MTSMSWGQPAHPASPQIEKPPQWAAMSAFIVRGAAPYLRHYEKIWRRRRAEAKPWPEEHLPFALAWHYSWFSNAKLDPLARSLNDQYEKGVRR